MAITDYGLYESVEIYNVSATNKKISICFNSWESWSMWNRGIPIYSSHVYVVGIKKNRLSAANL